MTPVPMIIRLLDGVPGDFANTFSGTKHVRGAMFSGLETHPAAEYFSPNVEKYLYNPPQRARSTTRKK